MEERTLLADIEVEKKKQVEKAFSQNQAQRKIKPQRRDKTINIFSADAFPKNDIISENNIKNDENNTKNDEILEKNVENEEKIIASENSTIIEKPNYDMIETLSDEQREKVFQLDKEEVQSGAKPKRNIFKMVLLSVMFALFGVWGIVNIAEINLVNNQIAEVSEKYSVNLVSYLNNLHNLDATNSNNMENLFETINENDLGAASVKEHSNWFDRFCNFIGGLFGG